MKGLTKLQHLGEHLTGNAQVECEMTGNNQNQLVTVFRLIIGGEIIMKVELIESSVEVIDLIAADLSLTFERYLLIHGHLREVVSN